MVILIFSWNKTHLQKLENKTILYKNILHFVIVYKQRAEFSLIFHYPVLIADWSIANSLIEIRFIGLHYFKANSVHNLELIQS